MGEEKHQDKPFSHPRWNEPIGGRVVGYKELTEEERKKAHEETIAVLKSMGIELKKEEGEGHDKQE